MIRTLNNHTSGCKPDKWKCQVYPEVGEALIVAVFGPGESSEVRRVHNRDRVFDSAEENQLRSVRRAKAQARRYVQANQLQYLWGFSYREPQCDWGAAGADWARFIRRHLRRHGNHPYLWVREAHEQRTSGLQPDSGLHLHALFPDRFPYREVSQDWGLGHVWVKKALPSKGKSATEWASDYLSKEFATIDLDLLQLGTARPERGRRYGVARNFNPTVIKYTATSRAEAGRIANELSGQNLYFRTIPVSQSYNGPAFEQARWAVSYSEN